MHRLQDLVRLSRLKTGNREVARLLGMSPNTEREYRLALKAAGMLEGSAEEPLPALDELRAAVLAHRPPRVAPQQLSSLESWLEQVTELMGKGLGPRAIHDRLRVEHPELEGKYQVIKRLCRRIRKARGVRPEDVAIPVDTRPGEVAQVDFGYVGRLLDPATGQRRKAWVFVLVLAFSRRMVTRVVFDQRVETWLRCHAEAFDELGGVVETVVPDNLKSAVIRASFGVGGPTALNRVYREFARHYGFKVDPTPVYSPKKKGKVESGVKYVKGNFFLGRADQDVTEVRVELARWVELVAGRREHGTTRRPPTELFEEQERAALLPLPARTYEPTAWCEVKVQKDSHVAFNGRLYSVPWTLIGQKLWLRATPSSVTVDADDVRVATHARNGPTRRSTVEEHLPAHRRDLRHRDRGYWEERAAKLGPETGALIQEVFASDDVLSMLGPAQAILLHLEKVLPERAEAAARRARYYGSYSYLAVKNILRRGLETEPLPVAVAPASAELPNPRFARNIRELLHLEVDVEPN